MPFMENLQWTKPNNIIVKLHSVLIIDLQMVPNACTLEFITSVHTGYCYSEQLYWMNSFIKQESLGIRPAPKYIF